MKSLITTLPISLLLSLTRPIDAYWRLACSVSQTSRIDPILSPGSISGHVHKFAGGNNVNENSDGSSLQSSTCSSCEVQQDKSAYWTPQLYYQHGNGQIEEVQNDGMTVYYIGRGGTAANTKPFPPGFKMISGNSQLRHYDNSSLTFENVRPIADRVSFRCINEANNIPETHYINDTNCVNGLRAQINFQSCWDGVNLYKSDQSHVAYLSGIDYGDCPSTHPVPIPGLFFEVLYWSNRIAQSDGGRFVFSNGDTTGLGFHGDFMNGWDQAVQTQAVQDCLYVDNGGTVSSCGILTQSDDVNHARTCPESKQVIDEVYAGILPTNALPGCNPITSGPADVSQALCGVNSTTPIAGTSASPSTISQTKSAAISTLTSTVNVQPTKASSTITGNVTSHTSGVAAQITSSAPGVFAQGAAASGGSTISGNSVSMSTSISLPANADEVVTIEISNYTTIALLIPATLTPQTSFSDFEAASSYIAALTSIAAVEATATGIVTPLTTAAIDTTTATANTTDTNRSNIANISTTFVTLYSPMTITSVPTISIATSTNTAISTYRIRGWKDSSGSWGSWGSWL